MRIALGSGRARVSGRDSHPGHHPAPGGDADIVAVRYPATGGPGHRPSRSAWADLLVLPVVPGNRCAARAMRQSARASPATYRPAFNGG